MKKIDLPFNATPPTVALLYNALAFGILCGDSIPSELLNFNIQLCFRAPKQDNRPTVAGSFPPVGLILFPRLTFARCRELGLFEIEDRPASIPDEISLPDFSAYIYGSLSEGRYIYMYLDHYFVPQSDDYFRWHRRHELLVVGCDATVETISCAMYTTNGKFSVVQQSLSQILHAFNSPFSKEGSAKYERPGRLATIYPNPVGRGLNHFLIAQQVDDYIESRPMTQQSFHPKLAAWQYEDAQRFEGATFGISVYASLTTYFEAVAALANPHFDPRITRLLWEHKKLMEIRILKLCGELSTSLDDLGIDGWRQSVKYARMIHNVVYISSAIDRRVDVDLINRYIRMLHDIEMTVFPKTNSAINRGLSVSQRIVQKNRKQSF